MPEPYATHTDVLDRWIGANPPSTDLVDRYIDDAGTMIRFEFPDIDSRIDAEGVGAVPADQVRLVVIWVVLRVLRNPDNARTVGAGPFATTYAGTNPGLFKLTEEERSMLSGIPSTGESRAYTIDPTPTADPGWIGGTGWDEPGWATIGGGGCGPW